MSRESLTFGHIIYVFDLYLQICKSASQEQWRIICIGSRYARYLPSIYYRSGYLNKSGSQTNRNTIITFPYCVFCSMFLGSLVSLVFLMFLLFLSGLYNVAHLSD